MTTTDQTPDAVRAAIAEALDDAFADTIDAYVENDETANAYLRGDLIRTVFTVLDQIGALRVVGLSDVIVVEPQSLQAMRIRRWAEFAYDHPKCPEWDDEDQELYAALGTIPEAAARAGDGAT